MNILMSTNSYLPQVGGVPHSVASFTEALRRRGHRVLVVAPEYEGSAADEQDVLRVPAIQHFNGSDFSVRLPIPLLLSSVLTKFQPELVHTHHPFLLGDTALRVAAMHNLPLVFTHHTLYEQYTHYVPVELPALGQLAIQLATEYANLCDHVVAPSQSIAELLHCRGVSAPITVIPTGIDPGRFANGDGRAARQRWQIPAEAFVVGHVGRLAPEKNLAFLAEAVARFIASHQRAYFLLVGAGPMQEAVQQTFQQAGLASRLRTTGALRGQELADAYHAMDVFAFASQSETQGMVLAEAMTAGVPVVALEGPGVHEVVEHGRNGQLVMEADEQVFADAIAAVAALNDREYQAMAQSAHATADSFSLDRCTDHLESLYRQLLGGSARRRDPEENSWAQVLRLLKTEWNLWSSRVAMAAKAMNAAP